MDDFMVLPFTAEPGVLRVAPCGSEEPRHTVGQGRFRDTWSASWVAVGPTTPSGSDAGTWQSGSKTGTWVVNVVPYRPVDMDQSVRLMFGWESDDLTSRVVAPQALPTDATTDVIQFRVEDPYPRRVPLVDTGLTGLLRRLLRLGPRYVLEPQPPFSVYTAGVLHADD
jgi:hypothetical protein